MFDADEILTHHHKQTRITWTDLPIILRETIQERLDSKVLRAVSQENGFSPGFASRVSLKNGQSIFIKAVSSFPNQESPLLHQREAQIAAALPNVLPVPRFFWKLEYLDWIILAFEDIEGHPPQFPWNQRELNFILHSLTQCASVLNPSPINTVSLSHRYSCWFYGWHKLATARQTPSNHWIQIHLNQLVPLEASWEVAVQGNALVHADLRADNVLIKNTGDIAIVDWAWACQAAPWFDLLSFLINVAALDKTISFCTLESLFSSHPLSKLASSEQINSVLAALAGFYMERSLAPAEPGLAQLRPFQHLHAIAACNWLALRLQWEPYT